VKEHFGEKSDSNVYLNVMNRSFLKLYFSSFLKENKYIIFCSNRLCKFLKEVLDLKLKQKSNDDFQLV